MTYELALKLKEAGFPQTLRLGSVFFLEDEKCCFASYVERPLLTGLLFPTLEELIEACGDKFECLARQNEPEAEVWWRAYQTDDSYKGACVVDCCGYETGDTPAEAVAKLWLALNVK